VVLRIVVVAVLLSGTLADATSVRLGPLSTVMVSGRGAPLLLPVTRGASARMSPALALTVFVKWTLAVEALAGPYGSASDCATTPYGRAAAVPVRAAVAIGLATAPIVAATVTPVPAGAENRSW
jgi:hypothetical protein